MANGVGARGGRRPPVRLAAQRAAAALARKPRIEVEEEQREIVIAGLSLSLSLMHDDGGRRGRRTPCSFIIRQKKSISSGDGRIQFGPRFRSLLERNGQRGAAPTDSIENGPIIQVNIDGSVAEKTRLKEVASWLTSHAGRHLRKISNRDLVVGVHTALS